MLAGFTSWIVSPNTSRDTLDTVDKRGKFPLQERRTHRHEGPRVQSLGGSGVTIRLMQSGEQQ
eukprot:3443806-Prymnesium_polylepis.1